MSCPSTFNIPDAQKVRRSRPPSGWPQAARTVSPGSRTAQEPKQTALTGFTGNSNGSEMFHIILENS